MDDLSDAGLAYLAVPSSGAGTPVLIVHSWWGLTASFIDFADRLADQGFVVGCADLYHGEIATTEADARRLRQLKRSQPTYKVLRHCLRLLSSDRRSTSPVPAVIGFSMGAHWAVWLAQHPDPAVGAAVLFYGARGGDFSNATAPLLAHFADGDDFVPASARSRMERAIGRQGLRYTAFEYPGTGHWFAESAHPAFDRVAAELALERTVSFLAGLNPC